VTSGQAADANRDQTSMRRPHPDESALPSSSLPEWPMPDARRSKHWMSNSGRKSESYGGGKSLLGAPARRAGVWGDSAMSTQHPEDPFFPVACDVLAEHRASIELVASEGSMRTRICLLDYSGGRFNMVLPWEESERGRVLWALRVYILWMMPKAVILSFDDTTRSCIETWAVVKGHVLGLQADFSLAPDFHLDKFHKDKRSLDDAPLIVRRISALTTPGRVNMLAPSWVTDALSILGSGGCWPTARYGGYGDGFGIAIC